MIIIEYLLSQEENFIRPSMLYGTDFWAVKKQYIHRMSVIEMVVLGWISRNTHKDRIKNEEIRLKISRWSCSSRAINAPIRER